MVCCTPAALLKLLRFNVSGANLLERHTTRVENHNYEKDGQEVYGFNFVVQEFEFGAPGSKKREQLAER
jgi:hypothetical protein